VTRRGTIFADGFKGIDENKWSDKNIGLHLYFGKPYTNSDGVFAGTLTLRSMKNRLERIILDWSIFNFLSLDRFGFAGPVRRDQVKILF
jgi:hypothetical protein